jgi:hypothetical protein
MTTVTESDIKELKDLIIAFREDTNNRFTAIDNKFNAIDNKFTSIDNRLTVIETRLDEWRPAIAKIPDLAEKVGELKNWRQIGLFFVTAFISSIFSGTIGGVIGWLLRSGKA